MENRIEREEKTIAERVLTAKVASVIAVVSLALGVTSYFSRPTQQNTDAIAILQARIEKDEALNEQLVTTLKNDTHSNTETIQNLNDQIVSLSKDIVQLTTIINERIPAKK